MGCAAIFLYSNTIDFMNATVVTTVDTMTVPLSEVFFPSVVVCNINQVHGLMVVVMTLAVVFAVVLVMVEVIVVVVAVVAVAVAVAVSKLLLSL